jgi:predicted nucleotide-binding protein
VSAIKPKLFVGSSNESLSIARAIKAQLGDVAEITVWKDDVFPLNDGNLEALLRAMDYFDFAVFVLSPDDSTTSRGKTQPSPRDNALFEFGLFLGHLAVTDTLQSLPMQKIPLAYLRSSCLLTFTA